MKVGRQKLILELISTQAVGTQQQLMAMLSDRGVQCTQSTLSRDIWELNLIKQAGADGVAYYKVNPSAAVENDAKKLLNITRLAALSFEAAQNIVVIKTMSGLANAVCSFVDKLGQEGLVGSIAGNDTVLLAMKDDERARQMCRRLQELLAGGERT